MLQTMTRPKAIGTWFVAVALIVAAGLALGVHVTSGNAALLLALCLVPPVIVLMLWPGVEPPTVSDIVHERDRRR